MPAPGTTSEGSALRLSGRRGGFDLEVDLAWDRPVLGLLGPSGAGKSSILDALLGLWPGARGRVVVGGAVLQDDAAGIRLPVEARGLGWLPQDLGLFPHLTVAENLRFGARRRHGGAEFSPEAEVAGLAARLGITPLLGRRVDVLSGGERQRVALGRALAAGPRALVLDEPLASLDRPLRARIVADLLALKATGLPMIYVSHDLHELWVLADVVAVIEGGRVAAFGPVREVLASPTAADHLSLHGVENLLAGVAEPVDGEAALKACVTPSGTRLVFPAFPSAPADGAPIRVAVRAEDVVLATGNPGATSAQNVLRGTVAEVADVARAALVAVDVGGDRVQVQVTARAVRALELAPGRPVTLLVKAHAVHLVGPAPVAPAGPR